MVDQGHWGGASEVERLLERLGRENDELRELLRLVMVDLQAVREAIQCAIGRSGSLEEG